MTPEKYIEKMIMLETKHQKTRLFKNNSGALQNQIGQWVRYGLGNDSAKVCEIRKSSDLIGYTIVTVTPEMVGKQVAIFTSIELKKDEKSAKLNNKHVAAQRQWLNMVENAGGIAGFAYDAESFHKVYEAFYDRFKTSQ